VLKLVIGNKNYSSWSMRPWLQLRESGIAFEEVRIALFNGDGWRQELASFTPSGKVPVLLDGDLPIWDSLAICEYVREKDARAIGWPTDTAARGVARAVSAEMHSGFQALRNELPMNIRARRVLGVDDLSDACRADIARIDTLWCSARQRYGAEGPWLFGRLSIADLMYAPVATRFVTYGIAVSAEAQRFIEAVHGLASFRAWAADAAAETERLEFVDQLQAYPKSRD
jgi:glutathione S-transferase